MSSRNGNNAEEVDRLSSLPDDLVHKILSFIDIKEAIGTSILSSRWRFVWTSMSCLHFSSTDFDTFPKFSEFVTQFLSHRNNQIQVSSLYLRFHKESTQPFLKNVLEYANSHNIQQLNVISNFSYDFPYNPVYVTPHPVFSSESLKHLSIKINRSNLYMDLQSLELPVLTTLYLDRLFFINIYSDKKCIAHFSKCPNLKNLTLVDCEMTKVGGTLSICHPRLSNLTLINNLFFSVVNVVAPQLENLIISLFRRTDTEYVISAPNLASLVYNGYEPLHISTYDFHSLKEADICVREPEDEDSYQMVCLLQQLHNAKFLTLNLEIMEILSSSLEPILNQPSPFANLESLKIYPAEALSEEEEQDRVKKSDQVKNYLLDNSPSVAFTMITREDQLVVPRELITHKIT